MLAAVDAEWPKLRDPVHPEHEPALNVGRRLRVATARAHEALDAAPAPAPRAEGFTEWLARQTERRDRVGRFALAAAADAGFPAMGAFVDYREHVLEVDGAESALQALARSWREFEDEGAMLTAGGQQ